MRKLKIIAAEVVQGGSLWAALTFENHSRRLCVNLSTREGGALFRSLFGSGCKDTSELVGREVLQAELPRQSCEFVCWEAA